MLKLSQSTIKAYGMALGMGLGMGYRIGHGVA
jgi:hypothetical protein